MDEVEIISSEEYYAEKSETYDRAYSLENDDNIRHRKIFSVKSLHFESFRLETFYYYKYKNTKDIIKMAKRGFYYNRRCDAVACYFCNAEIWAKTNYEEPLEHANGNGNVICAINKFPLNGNVPLLVEEVSDPDGTLTELNRMLRELMLQKLVPPDPVPKIYYFNEPKIFNPNSSPPHENLDFKTYEGRLASYDCWFEYLNGEEKPKRELFAKAGFVYSGFSDFVVCFECLGGLFNVHPDDDPVKDHAKYYGHCSFIREYCSSENIEINFTTYDMATGTIPLTNDEKELLMQHPMIKALINDGYEKLAVKKFIEDFVNIYCCFPDDIEMCKIGLDLEMKKSPTENLETNQSKRRRID